MGKVIYFLTIIIFLDLLLMATGQLCMTPPDAESVCSLNSLIFSSFLNIENFSASTFFSEIIGNIGNLFTSVTGIGALLVTVGLTASTIIGRSSDSVLFIPVGFTLALIGGDLVFITNMMLSANFILGVFIGLPLLISYIMVVLDWTRGKD